MNTRSGRRPPRAAISRNKSASFVSRIEQHDRIPIAQQPGIHALAAERQIEPLDPGQGQRRGLIDGMAGESIRIQPEHRSKPARGFRGERASQEIEHGVFRKSGAGGHFRRGEGVTG